MDDCLFCRIVAGQIPADIVFSDDRFLAFRDIAPQSPVHVLVIPKQHHANAAEFAAADAAAAGDFLATVTQLANEFGVDGSGYRIVLNTGEQGGQSVDHVHAHLMGGRQFGWPPG